ncbi:MAG: hypothetical protein JXA50_01575 [Deltaproteobacteria bacterium]|nr:hypothetical protein [Deltaproteobacteria bacterium]
MQKEAFLVEDLEGAAEVKRFLEDDLFTKHLKTNEAAKRLNISAERLYKYINHNTFNNNIPAFLIPLWTRMIGPEFLRYLAAESGYGIMKLPKVKGELSEAIKVASDAMKECSEALRKYLDGIDDGHVSLRELKDIKKEVIEAIEALLNLDVMAEKVREGRNG